MINSRLLNDDCGNGGTLELPKGDTSDICYTCPVNDEINSITTNIFRDFGEKKIQWQVMMIAFHKYPRMQL